MSICISPSSELGLSLSFFVSGGEISADVRNRSRALIEKCFVNVCVYSPLQIAQAVPLERVRQLLMPAESNQVSERHVRMKRVLFLSYRENNETP